MMFSKYGQAILTVHERTSRLLLGIRLASKVAQGVANRLVRLFSALPQSLRQTVTFDNGTEFACHLALHGLSIETYFCNPHSPWQKGGIENAIGRMRRFKPHGQPILHAMVTSSPRGSSLRCRRGRPRAADPRRPRPPARPGRLEADPVAVR